MDNLQALNYTKKSRYLNKVSFRAIIAGVIIATLVQLLLTLLGLAIGMVSFTPTTDAKPMSGFGTGAIIWIILTTIISLFAGGWVSGWLATSTNKVDRILHGALTWGIHTLLSVFLIGTSVGSILGGLGNMLSSTFSGVGTQISKNMPKVSQVIENELDIDINSQDLKALRDEAFTILRQTGKKELQPENIKNKAENVASEAKDAAKDAAQNPNNADTEAENLLSKVFNMSEDVVSEVDKEALVNVVVARTDKSKAEATELVNNWIETAKKVKQEAKQLAQEVKKEAEIIGEDVTDSIGKVAFYLFFGLLLGAASAIGGSVFSQNKVQYED